MLTFTVGIIDEYCAEYKDLFKEVRNYECFKYLHLGIISPLKRKSLPEIAKVVSINSAQSLHHFIACFRLVSQWIRKPKISENKESIKWKCHHHSNRMSALKNKAGLKPIDWSVGRRDIRRSLPYFSALAPHRWNRR